MAIGVLHAARRQGLVVPDDLSVVGFDDIEIARLAMPALTTVSQPLRELGRQAVSLLFRQIDGQKLDAHRVEIAAKLAVRGSTAAPRPISAP
jgi:LacI family transcriptional regulator